MVRVDGTKLNGDKMDWDGNGSISGPVASDAGFSGTLDMLKVGSDDWSALDLRHVGSRRNPLGIRSASRPMTTSALELISARGSTWVPESIWVRASTSARGSTWVPESISVRGLTSGRTRS